MDCVFSLLLICVLLVIGYFVVLDVLGLCILAVYFGYFVVGFGCTFYGVMWCFICLPFVWVWVYYFHLVNST